MYEFVTIIICAATVILPAAAYLAQALRGTDIAVLAEGTSLSTSSGRLR